MAVRGSSEEHCPNLDGLIYKRAYKRQWIAVAPLRLTKLLMRTRTRDSLGSNDLRPYAICSGFQTVEGGLRVDPEKESSPFPCPGVPPVVWLLVPTVRDKQKSIAGT